MVYVTIEGEVRIDRRTWVGFRSLPSNITYIRGGRIEWETEKIQGGVSAVCVALRFRHAGERQDSKKRNRERVITEIYYIASRALLLIY